MKMQFAKKFISYVFMILILKYILLNFHSIYVFIINHWIEKRGSVEDFKGEILTRRENDKERRPLKTQLQFLFNQNA